LKAILSAPSATLLRHLWPRLKEYIFLDDKDPLYAICECRELSELDDVGILVLDLLPEMLPLILHFLGVMAQLKHLVSHLVKLVLKVVILLLQFRVQQRYGIVLEEICHREALIPPNLVSCRLLRIKLGWEMRDRPRILA
jgi:hypothetical protein